MKRLTDYLKEEMAQTQEPGHNIIEESRDASSKLKYPDSKGVRTFQLFRELSVNFSKFKRSTT